MLEVLHRVHPSALLMMDTWLQLWEVWSKNNQWWHIKHVHSTYDVELDSDNPCRFS